MEKERVEIPCPKHGSHPPWKMRKKWTERAETPSKPTIRTREVFCPEDVYYGTPLGWWTGSGWLPLPGGNTSTAWCPWDREKMDMATLAAEEREGPKGLLTYALCPRCGNPIARVNRWGLKEAIYKEGQRAPEPSPLARP